MALFQYHAVQPFVRTSKGRVTAASPQMCNSPEQAKALAERLVEQQRAIGALAYSCDGDDAAGELGAPLFLARVGDVPETDKY